MGNLALGREEGREEAVASRALGRPRACVMLAPYLVSASALVFVFQSTFSTFQLFVQRRERVNA